MKHGLSVLHVDSSTSWGGGQNQVRLLMRELAAAGVRQLCICPAGSLLAQRLTAMHLPVRGIPWHGSSDPRVMWQLLRELRKFDVVHCHDAHALQVALLPAKLLRVKVVAARRVPFKTNAVKWNRADIVIAVSEHVREQLVKSGLDAGRVRVVHSGTDPAETRAVAPLVPAMREQRGVATDAFVVASAALLVPAKGLTIIPAAAALLPDVHWFIAGRGPLQAEIESGIAAHGVANRVHMLGWMPDARRLFKEIDVYLSASTEDGLGNSVTEALAMGVPVLSADGGGGAEIMKPVHDVTNAVLYEAQNARSLANAVRRLRDPALRARVLTAQATRFPTFDIARTAAQTLQLYREITEKR